VHDGDTLYSASGSEDYDYGEEFDVEQEGAETFEVEGLDVRHDPLKKFGHMIKPRDLRERDAKGTPQHVWAKAFPHTLRNDVLHSHTDVTRYQRVNAIKDHRGL